MTINCSNKYFQINNGTLWDGKTYYELYSETSMPWSWHYELKKITNDLGLIFFSTPYDKTAVDFLEKLEVPLYKIASFEITDLPFIEYVASKKRPLIISTGIAELSEIKETIEICNKVGNKKIILLKCCSLYPAPLDEINLLGIKSLIEIFNTIVGLSDHTTSVVIPVVSVAMGAKVIEKHFILNRKLGGPDAAFSLEPQEFKEMVRGIRETEKALGNGELKLTPRLKKSRKFCRSLFVIEDIKKGEEFTEKNIMSIRPGFGLPPKYLRNILGKKANKYIKKGTPLEWRMIRD
jgi:pseudaminic acid synthase